jgi:hypothetical protein
MEDINNRGLTTAILGKTVIRPRLLIQSLAFTGILYFCVGQAPPHSSETINQLPELPSALKAKGEHDSTTRSLLSPGFENSVLQHASKQLGLPTSALRITHAQSQTWSDNCLGIHDPEIFCTQTPVPGWQVEVKSAQQSWIYRTNATGSVIKIELQTSTPHANQLASAHAISQKFNVSPNRKSQTLAKGI